MREGLTFLAILVILALTAALVGPYFVDWAAQRAIVETKLSEALGTRVKVGGTIDLKLLPSPRLTLGNVTVGGSSNEEAPVAAKEARVELGVTALLRGEISFTEATFDNLRVKLAMSEGGVLALPGNLALPEHGKIQFDKISVHHGTLIVEAAGQRGFMLREIGLEAQASSILGPFRGSGSVLLRGKPTAFRFSTGALDGGRLRLKLGADATAEAPRAELDGSLVFPGAKGGDPKARPAYEGNLTLSGSLPLQLGETTTPIPWRWSGSVVADLAKVTSAGFDLHLGDDQRTVSTAGSGEIDFGSAPRAQVSLAAKQLDIDRLMAQSDGAVVRPMAAATLLRTALDSIGARASMPVAVDFTVGMLALGGDGLTDIQGELAFDPDRPVGGRLEANGPGHSRLVAAGTLEAGAAARFKGHLDFAAHDRPRLAAWLGQGAPELTRSIDLFLPFKDVALAGDVEISGVGFAGNDLKAKLDRSAFAGVLTFYRAVDRERARLYADVTSEALDVDTLPDMGWAAAASADLDLALHVVARAAKIQRVGEASVDSGRLELELTKTAGTTKLDRLSIAGLGGASVEATGSLDASGARLEAGLDAASLADFANLLHHLVPGQASDALMRRAALLSPAKLSLRLTAKPGETFANATLDGMVGSTKISGAVQREGTDPDSILAKLDLDAADTPLLLRQIGLDSLPLKGLGRGRIGFGAHGRLSADLDGSMEAKLAGTDLAWHGRITPAAHSLEGRLTLKSGNVAPLLQSLALALPDATSAQPADLSGELGYQLDRLSLRQIEGGFAGAKMAGDLALTLVPEATLAGDTAMANLLLRPHLEGELRIDHLAGSAIAGLALGPPQPAATGKPWSELKFAPALAAPPDSDLALQVGALDLGSGLVARSAAFKLALRPNLVSLDSGQASLDGATLTGKLTLRRNGPVATISGHVGLRELAIDKPFAAGKLAADLDFTSSGESQDQLVGDLAGQGSVTLTNAHLPGLDADALTRVIGAADAEKLPLDSDAVTLALAKETARSGRDLPKLALPATLAGGVLHLRSVSLPDPRASIVANAAIDLRPMTIDAGANMRLVTAPAGWTGAPPEIDVAWSGPWAAPKRDIDASGFFSGLSARSLSINLERLEALDADIRERAFFNRRLKAIQADEERERERAAAEADAAQRRSEAERRAAEVRAEENQRSVETPPVRTEEPKRRTQGVRGATPLSQVPPAAEQMPGLY